MRQGKWLVLGTALTVFLWCSPLAQCPVAQAAEKEKAVVTPLSDEEVSAVRDFLTNFKGIKFNGFVESFYQFNSVDPRGADGVIGQQGAVGGRRGFTTANNEVALPGGAKRSNLTNTTRNISDATNAFTGNARPRFLEVRAFDKEDNSFTLNNIELHIYKEPTEPGDIGFRITTLYGEIAHRLTFVPSEGRVDDTSFTVGEGFVWWKMPVGKGIDLKFGKFATFIGAEVWESVWNPNWSRSLLYNNAIPFTHTGLSIGYPLLDSLYATAFFVNGWDTFVDNNHAKTVGYQFRYTIPELPVIHKAFFVLNGIHGAEQPDNDSNMRHFWDVIFQFNPISKLTLNTNFDFGTEQFESGVTGGASMTPTLIHKDSLQPFLVSPANDAGPNASTPSNKRLTQYLMFTDERKVRKWWGVAQMANFQATDRIGFALRGEYFWDEEAARIIPVSVRHINKITGTFLDTAGNSTDQNPTGGLAIGEVTGTFNFKIRDKLMIRPEVRWDKIMSAHGGTSAEQFDGHNNNLTSGVAFTYEF